MEIAALPREQKSQCLLMGLCKISKHNACELLVNSKEAFKQNRKRVLNHWSHKHEKKVQVMLCPTPDFYLSCFSQI